MSMTRLSEGPIERCFDSAGSGCAERARLDEALGARFGAGVKF
jgi:hypothetical protein